MIAETNTMEPESNRLLTVKQVCTILRDRRGRATPKLRAHTSESVCIYLRPPSSREMTTPRAQPSRLGKIDQVRRRRLCLC